MGAGGNGRLTRSLGLRHVFALSTGAMLSSGLFLLPGLAAAKAGPAAVLAYLIAGVLAVPAMLSVAELSTALPKAGGAYYFLERALGPSVGTMAGFGTWLSLVLKDAFAMVGMSAYLVLIVDIDSRSLALVLITLFMVVNIAGSKASASLQLCMVAFVVAVLGWFIVSGLLETRSRGFDGSNLDPFFTTGSSGVFAVVGLVFVSYGGLTKVASAAEEVEDPSQRIPLGMALSLMVATVLYTLGVLVAVAVVPPEVLHGDLAPIHTAAKAVLPSVGVWLIVVAALAAFASAVNAGIMAAARYPMAMARDGLLPARIGAVGSRGTPVAGIVVTSAAIAVVVMVFDAESIAKLASAFVLLTLGLVNLAVLVLRASRIASYAPAFRTPLYPVTQFAGILVSVVLISRLGPLAWGFVIVVSVLSWTWHRLYATGRTKRAGAVRNVFRRWGEDVDTGLDREMSAAMAGHGLRSGDDYTGLVARAAVLSIPEGTGIAEAADRASAVLADRIGLPREQAILLPKEAFKLRERRLWSFATNQVAGVTIQLDNKPTQFVRLPNSTWRSADNEALDQIQSAMLEETIYRMGVLFAIGWVAEGEAAMEATGIQLGANQLTAEVDTADGPRQFQLEFGDKGPLGRTRVMTGQYGTPTIFSAPNEFTNIYFAALQTLGLAKR